MTEGTQKTTASSSPLPTLPELRHRFLVDQRIAEVELLRAHLARAKTVREAALAARVGARHFRRILARSEEA